MSLRRFLLTVCGILVFGYAIAVLVIVQLLPDMDLRTVFSNDLRRPPLYFDTQGGTFHPNDKIVRIGDRNTTGSRDQTAWAQVLKAPSEIARTPELREYQNGTRLKLPDWIEIRKEDGQVVDPETTAWNPDFSVWIKITLLHPGKEAEPATIYTAWCRLGQVPLRDLVPSMLWFFLKTTLLLVGAWVWWKRPDEPAVEQFYIMCLVTMAAYIGGYHWTLIAASWPLVVVFIVAGTLLPAVNLHYYLVFPRQKEWLARRPRLALSFIYGVPLVFTAVILFDYVQVRWPELRLGDDPQVVLDRLKTAIYGYFGVAAAWYIGTVAALVHSYWTLQDPSERNQARTVLFGASLAMVPIFYSLYLALVDVATFSEGGATWPMFAASVILSIAYAVSITRYRLIELDKFLSSSMDYFVASFIAAMLYYAIVFAGTLLFNRYIASPRFSEAVTVSATALLLLLVLDQLRGRVRKFLDRRFAKQKTQLDRTLHRMGQAIEQLVDPHSLAVKFLNATTELLGASQGAIFMRHGDPAIYRITGFQGSAPAVGELPPGSPLIDELGLGKTIVARLKPYEPLSLAQRQLRNLGGEIAQPIMHEDRLLAFLVLGPKDPPYRPEDEELLAAFAQITGLALQSAEGHRTIEQLNIELRGKVQKISEQQRRILALQSQLTRQIAPPKAEAVLDDAAEPPAAPSAGIVGGSSEVQHLLDLTRKVAAADSTVLLRGESGTGKELLARAVHEASPRADRAFVKVHCTALSPTLLESELFGHVKGAFTGAHKDKVGRFEMAHGGTLFLDEIGDISLDVQTKLLRVLQERTIERVGSSDPIQVDVRIITATHQNLESLIRQGKFREDLFYRLNVFPVQVPPLRQRVSDIPALANHFLRQSSQKCKKEITSIDAEVMTLLKSYSWPGNIRQLENVIERAVVIAESSSLTVAELPAEVFQFADERPTNGFAAPDFDDFDEPAVTRPVSPLRRERLRSEREELVRAMAAAHGNKSEAARALGVARSTLVSRLKKFGLV